MRYSLRTLLFIALGFLAISATVYDYNCLNLPSVPFNYGNIIFPRDVNNHPEIDNMDPANVTTDEGATLGRVLFYDVDLSQNHTVSCASCHQQQFAFTDSARFSVGFDGSVGDRNSMSLMHIRFHLINRFFWDGRASSVEEQVLMPFQNPIEMGMTLPEVVSRVQAKPFYAPLFQSAFGSTEINSDRISKALAQFVRSINTFDSKFRRGIELTSGNPSTTPFVNFTPEENLGKDLFMDIYRGNCQACHTKNLMVPEGAQNIGLDLEYTDNGFGALTGNPNSNQNGKFKVPSLINVALTAPYMHDGRFKTLEEVVDFYSDSVHAHVNLSGFLREILPGNTNPNNDPCMTCPPRRPHFSASEKQAIVAFLHTLTDSSAITDERWSNPFCEVGAPLSVKFIEPINATKIDHDIKITWNTATEINCMKFEVEKSKDGISFESIGSVNGSGNSSLKHAYTLIDNHAWQGVQYYRIKEVDFDGKFIRSKVFSINMSDIRWAEMSVLPNVIKYNNNVTLNISCKNDTQASIQIFNSSGQLYSQQNVSLAGNTMNKITIDKVLFTQGIYYISLTSNLANEPIITQKIIVQ